MPGESVHHPDAPRSPTISGNGRGGKWAAVFLRRLATGNAIVGLVAVVLGNIVVLLSPIIRGSGQPESVDSFTC